MEDAMWVLQTLMGGGGEHVAVPSAPPPCRNQSAEVMHIARMIESPDADSAGGYVSILYLILASWLLTRLAPNCLLGSLGHLSTDYGTTYTKLNLMPGTTIVVTSFYICPTNKKKYSTCSTATHIPAVKPINCQLLNSSEFQIADCRLQAQLRARSYGCEQQGGQRTDKGKVTQIQVTHVLFEGQLKSILQSPLGCSLMPYAMLQQLPAKRSSTV
ncbi:VPS10 domain-containing receptor SorCS2 Precursor [Channa argus]|uniref:VPS10 domain-containing receptor SorCS2 n=1 Tax=Channa argus TaxID=215402 RepID=A0A6G1Q5J3_CHAAH|nr:VPS10 domain-containing receptor SorCS2 Precursor [Channa argus]